MSKIEFIIPTYNRPYNLITMLGCLLSQTNDKWVAHIVSDGYYEGYDDIKLMFSKYDNFKFTTIKGPNNDWGHTAREFGLYNATEEWVVMTGDDNYYVPKFVDFFLNSIDANTNFIYTNMLHNNAQYLPVNTCLKLGDIDIGCFMTRTELAKEIKLNKTYTADWDFVFQYCSRFCVDVGSIKKINTILYVHN
jgi:glycosyltransferase involved in cell wall biosynthesis